MTVLAAVDQGKVTTDARVAELLSALLPAGGATDSRVGDMTVAHLLHHTAGWTQVGVPDDPLFRMKEIAAQFNVASPPDAATVVRWILSERLGFAPGSGYRYTNIGYVMLARVVEAATGSPYEEFAREHVFAPAGVTRARIGGITREQRLEGEVEYESSPSDVWRSIFDGSGDEPLPEPAYGGINLPGLDGSSGWVLSVVDLARLGVALDGDDGVPDVLAPATRDVLFTNGASPHASYGAGFVLASADAARSIGLRAIAFGDHSGGMPGTNTYLHLREDGLVLAFAMNAARGGLNDFLLSLLRQVSAVDTWPDHDLFARYR